MEEQYRKSNVSRREFIMASALTAAALHQLLLDENDDPKVLFAACSIDTCNNKQDGGTFNVQIPVKRVKK